MAIKCDLCGKSFKNQHALSCHTAKLHVASGRRRSRRAKGTIMPDTEMSTVLMSTDVDFLRRHIVKQQDVIMQLSRTLITALNP